MPIGLSQVKIESELPDVKLISIFRGKAKTLWLDILTNAWGTVNTDQISKTPSNKA